MQYDVLIIGGGITGAGILLEASKRGLKCLLVEQQDFTWGTSSRSSKMVHGGLRYLASGALKLTRDAVRERRRLLAEAPGLVEPLNFFMPHYKHQFPSPKIFNGLMTLYDALAGQQNHEFYAANECQTWASDLQPEQLLGATRFADAIVDDARLVLRVLQEARALGAETLNYHPATTLLRDSQGQVIGATLRQPETDALLHVNARVVVNATGAWSDQLRRSLGSHQSIRPLRGSHLIVPFWRLPVTCAVSFAHPSDQRPVFIFPWEGVTMIGTTDLDHHADLNLEASISAEEVDYLLQATNFIFPHAQLKTTDIQASMAGVRPVIAGRANHPSKEKRDHAVWNDQGLISVAGGKLTTFRLIALDVLAKIKPVLPQAGAPAAEQIFTSVHRPRPVHLPLWHWQRLLGRYGDQAEQVLALSSLLIDNTNIFWGELMWAAKQEQVHHLDDVLLRRTRLGLVLPQGAESLAHPLQQHLQPLLGWSDEHWQQEWQRYLALWQRYYSPQPTARSL